MERAHNPVHDGDILPFDAVHDDLAHLGGLIAVPEEKEISTLKGRFHAARQDDNNGGGGVGDDGEGFPEHEGRAEDQGEIKYLHRGLSRVVEEGGREGGEHRAGYCGLALSTVPGGLLEDERYFCWKNRSCGFGSTES